MTTCITLATAKEFQIMVFSSMVFLTVFLPAVLIISCLLPSTRLKNLFLMAASLLFYAYGETAVKWIFRS